MYRINDFIRIGQREVLELFSPLNNTTILHFSLLDDSMSNTGYMVATDSGKYLLKLYSNRTDKIEAAMYAYLKGKINLPELVYYDGSKQQFDFSYAILEFIEGKKLKDHILAKNAYSYDLIYAIGEMCGIVHQKTYSSDAWLDPTLREYSPIPKTREHILQLLNDKAGTQLKHQTANLLLDYMNNNSELFEQIHSESVLCHGDFNYGNIIVSGNKPYLIDYEFARAGSRYFDLGKFFRRKSDALQALIDERVYIAFTEGYNSVSSSKLPPNWLTLAHLCDITSMLSLINRDNAPLEWISDIETDILNTINANNTSP